MPSTANITSAVVLRIKEAGIPEPHATKARAQLFRVVFIHNGVHPSIMNSNQYYSVFEKWLPCNSISNWTRLWVVLSEQGFILLILRTLSVICLLGQTSDPGVKRICRVEIAIKFSQSRLRAIQMTDVVLGWILGSFGKTKLQ